MIPLSPILYASEVQRSADVRAAIAIMRGAKRREG
jgi:hypothetical protein